MDFCILLKIWVKILVKTSTDKYDQKRLDHAKQSATNALKTSSKREIQKTAEVTGDLIGSKIPNKITKVSGSSPQNNLETIRQVLQR